MEPCWMQPKRICDGRITITDVRALPGDSAFLIDDGHTAVLYDTGFDFTCRAVIENIRKTIGDRPVDYILLTHSHYDHALGILHLMEEYPQVKVVAGEYAAQVFTRASAGQIMCMLNKKSAEAQGLESGDPEICRLKVDIPVTDGAVVLCGSMIFTAIALPGHTKCSFGYYLAAEKLLLSVETLGVYFGKDTYLPSFLVGYELTLDSFRKVGDLIIERMLLPHYGLVEHEQVAIFLEKSQAAVIQNAQTILRLHRCGKTQEEIFDYLAQRDYGAHVRPVYPFEAFRINTQIMIGRAIGELAAEGQETGNTP